MSNLKLQALNKRLAPKKLTTLRPGYQVRVHQKIKEGEKERVQIFEGLVISLSSGAGPNKTVTVRKVVEGIGVEKIFPLSSPNVVKIEIKKTFMVRRAKLNYLTKKAGLSNRLKAKLGLTGKDDQMVKDKGGNEEVMEEAAPEAVEEKKEEPVVETAPAEGAAA